MGFEVKLFHTDPAHRSRRDHQVRAQFRTKQIIFGASPDVFNHRAGHRAGPGEAAVSGRMGARCECAWRALTLELGAGASPRESRRHPAEACDIGGGQEEWLT